MSRLEPTSNMIAVIGLMLFLAVSAEADEVRNFPLLDESGRELIPGGFVVLEDITYTADDYHRMVRMGANFQVIRMPIWTVGAWPGRQPDEKMLAHFDDLVRLGEDAGMKTIFKLVFYGVRPFGDQQWDMVWNNGDGAQDKILEGWTLIWKRYQDNPAVFGYDLVNEPAHGLSKDYDHHDSASVAVAEAPRQAGCSPPTMPPQRSTDCGGRFCPTSLRAVSTGSTSITPVE